MRKCCGSCKYFQDMLVLLKDLENKGEFIVAGCCPINNPEDEVKRKLLLGYGRGSYTTATRHPCDKYVSL